MVTDPNSSHIFHFNLYPLTFILYPLSFNLYPLTFNLCIIFVVNTKPDEKIL